MKSLELTADWQDILTAEEHRHQMQLAGPDWETLQDKGPNFFNK